MTRDMEKAALRGEPSYVWRDGQRRRLKMIQAAAGSRIHGTILDNGCGVGMYLEHLQADADKAFGLEYDHERARAARQRLETIVCAAGESLPYPNSSFDLILSHEVLEHVDDDRQSMAEMARVLRTPDTHHEAGRIAVFVPNRGYPFETHGVYWRGRYHFGNKPLVNYLPLMLRERLAPHVRVYTRRDVENLIQDLPLKVISRTTVFGAYDNIIARFPVPGKALRTILHFLERTPFQVFGLSHFWILEKRKPDA